MRPRAEVKIISTFLLFLIVLTNSTAQSTLVRSGQKSSWIETVTYDPESRPSEGQAAGYYYLLMDEQQNTATQEDFFHYSYVVLTTEAIQNMSDLTFDFDPSYQQMTVHEIRIIRNNASLDRLPTDIKAIQREESMDRYLYDESRTAIVHLKDIRVGDIVEYSFTRKGFNPVHKGHIARTFYFDFYQSLDKYFKKLIIPASTDVVFKNLGDSVPEPAITTRGGLVHYTWSLDKPDPDSYDDNTPDWYNTSKIAMISDFESWKKVGDWAHELFVVSQTDREKIKKEVALQFKSGDDADYILEVIHFVQDEVRYLGFESGVNSHKPHSPLQIYEQRFGDCKDKSLLLVSLLEAKGIEAYPVLINTSLKDKLDDRLACGNIFDHCVVQILFEGKKIYIDPTISSQGGDLNHYHFPDYRRGLVIDNEIDGLDELPTPETATTTEMQTFKVLTIGGEAELTIKTSYQGSSADYQRAEFAQTSLETIQKNYKQYYANLYPDITESQKLTFHDDRSRNVFIIEENYKIASFWRPIEKEENKISCILQPQSITHYFDVNKNIQQRTSPFHLQYPVDFYHHIHIQLPEEWNIAPIDQLIETDSYLYEYSVKTSEREISLLTHYQTKKDHVQADKIAEYVADHGKMYGNLVYQLTYDTSAPAASDSKVPGAVLPILSIIAGMFIMFIIYQRYDPKPARYMVHGSPIGGWLMLLALGTVLSPIRIIIDLVKDPDLFAGSTWFVMLSAKRYAFSAYLIISQVCNIFRLLFAVLLAILFFQRRTSFPMLMTIQLVMSFVISLIDTSVARSMVDDVSEYGYSDAGRALLVAVIWAPYLNISQRVKDTFVVRTRDHSEYENKEFNSPDEITEANNENAVTETQSNLM
jgi:hypothetical protein